MTKNHSSIPNAISTNNLNYEYRHIYLIKIWQKEPERDIKIFSKTSKLPVHPKISALDFLLQH